MSHQGNRGPKARASGADDWHRKADEEPKVDVFGDDEDEEEEEETKDENNEEEEGEEGEEDDEDVELEEPLQILPYLYIGDETAARNKEALDEAGITDIINTVADSVENHFPDDYKYHTFSISSAIDEPIEDFFEPVYELIANLKEENRKVLLHCGDGLEVSPALVLAYMLRASYEKHKKLPLKDALAHVQKKNPDAQPNDGFMSKLLVLEKRLYGEVSMRMTSGKPRRSNPDKKGHASAGVRMKGRKRGFKRGKAW
eukprot:TRINITY_DN345_c0_g1_i2.p2 TRINITY_DN345_c0_g1~~TRINITY_DN345_c0_g1_i2.p2  ORF type:complete len:281 (+),score=94.90 TRINITY_DN345_c0_g1_i2:75-845(+)